jgi:hypothetical protein
MGPGMDFKIENSKRWDGGLVCSKPGLIMKQNKDVTVK